MKKLLFLIPILILVAVFAFFDSKPSAVSAKSLPACHDSASYCVEKINCKAGFDCQLHVSPITDCRVKISKNCAGGLCTTHGCPQGFKPVYESAGLTIKTNILAKIASWFVKPCLGTNCWSGGENKGWRDNSNQTGPDGATKSCEAKLHVCFAGGAGDPAIPCEVNTFRGCDGACAIITNNIACTPEVCASRCYAARVPGYADTCD
jgi:hypothetical protein